MTLKQTKADRLRAAGWKLGGARYLLGLSSEESALIELKLAVAKFLLAQRRRRDLTQTALAKRLGSSQSRVAKIEAGDASVSLDLMFRAAFSLGVSPAELGRAIGKSGRARRSARRAG